jgi:hypothetical protein
MCEDTLDMERADHLLASEFISIIAKYKKEFVVSPQMYLLKFRL